MAAFADTVIPVPTDGHDLRRLVEEKGPVSIKGAICKETVGVMIVSLLRRKY